jgi:hypothetical protein
MSNSSYTLLNSSTDKLDVDIPIKESVSSTAMTNSNEALKKKYVQIAFAVTLYWYENIFASPLYLYIYLGLFQLQWSF